MIKELDTLREQGQAEELVRLIVTVLEIMPTIEGATAVSDSENMFRSRMICAINAAIGMDGDFPDQVRVAGAYTALMAFYGVNNIHTAGLRTGRYKRMFCSLYLDEILRRENEQASIQD